MQEPNAAFAKSFSPQYRARKDEAIAGPSAKVEWFLSNGAVQNDPKLAGDVL
jgi:hypothetical protein